MPRMCKAVKTLEVGTGGSAVKHSVILAATVAIVWMLGITSAVGQPKVQLIPGFITGPPMRNIIIKGSYVEAIRIAYSDWQTYSRRGTSIYNQNVIVTPGEKPNWFYVRFVPQGGSRAILGCATKYGLEVLYTIDVKARHVVHKDIPC